MPHFAPVLHRTSATPQGTAIDPDFFGSDASIKPVLSSSSIRIHHSTISPSPTALLSAGSLKESVPAKSGYLTYTMAPGTPTSTPINAPHVPNGIFGWRMPAEIAFFVSVAILGLCLPLGLFLYLRRRRQAKEPIDELPSPSSSSMNTDLTLRGSTTRPPTASSWLEMLKHRTETPSPPHANDDNKDTYYEPPKPINFARRKFCTRKSGRMSEADIEKEVRELDEEVRRRSKLSRSRGQSVGVLPDLEDPCSECALSYTHDERGHTQPVEGRKGTPIPFLASVELDLAVVAAVVKEDKEEREEEEGEGEGEKETIREDIDEIKAVEEKVQKQGK